MKTLALAALAVMALPALAQAQAQAQGQAQTTPSSPGAAATLPDAFQQPGAAPGSVAPLPAPATAQAPDIARSEEALRAFIAAAQAGEIDYSVFSDNLAEQIRAQSAQVTPLIQGFGAVRSVEHKGNENGADLFVVTFANQATDWVIGFDDDNQIAALLFRPSQDD